MALIEDLAVQVLRTLGGCGRTLGATISHHGTTDTI
jgi:hypothetical protein